MYTSEVYERKTCTKLPIRMFNRFAAEQMKEKQKKKMRALNTQNTCTVCNRLSTQLLIRVWTTLLNKQRKEKKSLRENTVWAKSKHACTSACRARDKTVPISHTFLRFVLLFLCASCVLIWCMFTQTTCVWSAFLFCACYRYHWHNTQQQQPQH